MDSQMSYSELHQSNNQLRQALAQLLRKHAELKLSIEAESRANSSGNNQVNETQEHIQRQASFNPNTVTFFSGPNCHNQQSQEVSYTLKEYRDKYTQLVDKHKQTVDMLNSKEFEINDLRKRIASLQEQLRQQLHRQKIGWISEYPGVLQNQLEVQTGPKGDVQFNEEVVSELLDKYRLRFIGRVQFYDRVTGEKCERAGNLEVREIESIEDLRSILMMLYGKSADSVSIPSRSEANQVSEGSRRSVNGYNGQNYERDQRFEYVHYASDYPEQVNQQKIDMEGSKNVYIVLPSSSTIPANQMLKTVVSGPKGTQYRILRSPRLETYQENMTDRSQVLPGAIQSSTTIKSETQRRDKMYQFTHSRMSQSEMIRQLKEKPEQIKRTQVLSFNSQFSQNPYQHVQRQEKISQAGYGSPYSNDYQESQGFDTPRKRGYPSHSQSRRLINQKKLHNDIQEYELQHQADKITVKNMMSELESLRTRISELEDQIQGPDSYSQHTTKKYSIGKGYGESNSRVSDPYQNKRSYLRNSGKSSQALLSMKESFPTWTPSQSSQNVYKKVHMKYSMKHTPVFYQ